MWAYFFRIYDNGLREIEWFLQERGQFHLNKFSKIPTNMFLVYKSLLPISFYR